MDNDEIPFVAIGNDEIKEDAKERIEELMISDKKEDGIKLLSLLMSKGKTENGKTLHCSNNCSRIYIVFPYDKPRDCECGGVVEWIK